MGREGGVKREGTYVYLWLIHVDVWRKPTQYRKAIILPFKINKCLRNTQVCCATLCENEIRVLISKLKSLLC